MTIDEAIEILEKEQEDTFMGSEKVWKSALKLGSEALKVVEKWREQHRDLGFLLLPGETKD